MPRESVVAEKWEAVVSLGFGNSRMKDFFDLRLLSRAFAFEGATLAAAIAATFARRDTALPLDPPIAFTPAFTSEATKQQSMAQIHPRSAGVARKEQPS